MTQTKKARNNGNMIQTDIEPLVDMGLLNLLSNTLDCPLTISNVSSSGNSLGIMHILEKLDLPGKIDSVCSTEVSKKGFSLTSEGDPRLGVGHCDSSDISEVIPILARLLLATNLAFFYNICSGLSTRYTNLACCTIEV